MKKIIKGKNLVPVTIVDLNLDDSPDLNSTDPITSRGVANAINESAGSIKALIPEGTTAGNPLVNASGIANKADANKVVAIADATISASSSQDDKWYKVATLKNTVTNALTNIIGTWDIAFNKSNYVCPVKLCVNIRINANSILFYQCNALTADKSIIGDFIIKVVTRGAPGNVSVEIWISSSRNSGFYGIMVSETTTGSLLAGSNVKSLWNYTSYVNPTQGTTEPVTDVDNNVIATAASYSVIQYGDDINNLMTDDNGDHMTETPPKQVYVVGKFYFVNGKICRCTAYSASSATFDVYGVVEAMNYILSQT